MLCWARGVVQVVAAVLAAINFNLRQPRPTRVFVLIRNCVLRTAGKRNRAESRFKYSDNRRVQIYIKPLSKEFGVDGLLCESFWTFPHFNDLAYVRLEIQVRMGVRHQAHCAPWIGNLKGR
jgi:hypothetical protein